MLLTEINRIFDERCLLQQLLENSIANFTSNHTESQGKNKLHYLDVAVEIKDKNLLKTKTEYKSKDTFSHLIREAHLCLGSQEGKHTFAYILAYLVAGPDLVNFIKTLSSKDPNPNGLPSIDPY